MYFEGIIPVHSAYKVLSFAKKSVLTWIENEILVITNRCIHIFQLDYGLAPVASYFIQPAIFKQKQCIMSLNMHGNYHWVLHKVEFYYFFHQLPVLV